jgi:hypothetical protein
MTPEPRLVKRACRFETGLFLSIFLTLTIVGRASYFDDPGELWHIVVGELILSSGELVRTDLFSFTAAGQPWTPQWWLFECALAALHRLGGLDAVMLATSALIAALFTWIGRRLHRAGIHPLIVLLMVGLALDASVYHLHPRPHLVTIVLLAWTFGRLCDAEAGRIPLSRLAWLVPVFVLWTNVHGGVVGGMGTVAAVVAGWCVAWRLGLPSPVDRAGQIIALIALILACAATALVNPYGLAMPRVWFSLMGSLVLPRLMEEHMPLRDFPAEAAMVLLLGGVYVAALAGVPRRQLRVTWLIPLVWLGMAWTRIRHGPLFAVTGVIALGEMLPRVRWVAWLARKGSVACQIRPSSVDRPSGDWRPALLPGAVVLTALTLQFAGISLPVLGRGWAHLDSRVCPVELLPEIHAHARGRPDGTLIFNDMLYGGFLIYSAPEFRVFIDDRCELYGDSMLEAYADAAFRHPERIDQWAREYGFDLALVRIGSRFDGYLARAAGWSVAARGATAILYRRVPGRPLVGSVKKDHRDVIPVGLPPLGEQR